MKKLLILLMITLLLSGCGAQDKMQATETAEATEPVTETEAPMRVDQPCIVRMDYKKKELYDSDLQEVKLLDFGITWPQIENLQYPGGASNITAFLKQENLKFQNGSYPEDDLYASIGMDESLRYAKERYAELKENFYPFAVERTCRIHRADQEILSLSFFDYLNLGGAHGSQIETSYVFNIESGERLSLEDLSDTPQDMMDFLTEKMAAIVETDPDIKDRINWFEQDQYEEVFWSLLRDGSWYLDWENLVISSLQYELGAYAAGSVQFIIPLDDLNEYLKTQFRKPLPEQGILTVSEETELPIADEINRGEYPAELYLEARGSVYDLALTPVTMTENGETLRKEATIWYCGLLKDRAISLKVEVPEMIPDLLISFRDSDGAVHQGLLTQSGEDGSFFLMDSSSYFPYG